MTQNSIGQRARELLDWLKGRLVHGTLPDDAYDALFRGVGMLLWNAFSEDESKARNSDGIRGMLAALNLTPEQYEKKFDMGRATVPEGACGYWPPVSGKLLKDVQALRELQNALTSLASKSR